MPETRLAMVMVSERLKARVALSVTLPVPRLPVAPPLPTCRVPPALMAVVPV